MRRFFKVLPIALFALVAAAVISARSLPASRTLERGLIVEAPIERVYARLARIRSWRGWYVPPEAGRFEGPEEGPGGVLIVEDEESGELRRLELTETSSPTRVAYRFPDPAQTPYDIVGSFELESLGPRQTRVTSRQSLASRAPDNAWMARAGERWFLYVFADRFVSSILERELHNLAAALDEERPTSADAAPQ